MKISLAAENERTVFQKLREAALAYHLTRKWSKERILAQLPELDLLRQRRLRDRVGRAHLLRLQPRRLRQPEGPAALRLGAAARTRPRCWPAMVASPSALRPDPAPVGGQAPARPRPAAHVRAGLPHARDLRRARRPSRCPTRDDLTFPKEDTEYPYFTSWIKQQVVDRLGGGQQGAQLAFEGGLRVKTTIDSRLQTAAEKAIDAWLPNRSGPRASLVAISNKDGEVRAMIGGDNYDVAPVQPRHAGPAPARLLVQAVRARRGAQEGHQPELHLGRRKKLQRTPSRAASASRSTTTRTPTRA